MKPFFFGSSEKPLYGIYHPPTSESHRREGVVLCYPFGREYLRAHRALRELAHRLAAEGFHALRFDYAGTGDSYGDGDEVSVETWVEDVASALQEVRSLSGFETVSLLGLRFGAVLAALAARREPAVARLALWDPVVVGTSYVKELLALQREWSLAHPGLDANDADGSENPEILGFPLTRKLRHDMESVDLLLDASLPAERVLVLTGVATAEAERLGERFAAARGDFVLRRVPGSKFWLRGEGIHQALVPSVAIQAIAEWFRERPS